MYNDGSEVTIGLAKRHLNAADSSHHVTKIGGIPKWHSTTTDRPPLYCAQCGQLLRLIFTLQANIEDPEPLERALYFYGCTLTTCCTVSTNWKVIRDQIRPSAIASTVTAEIVSKPAVAASTTWEFLSTTTSIISEDDDLSYFDQLLAKRDTTVPVPAAVQVSIAPAASLKELPLDNKHEEGWLVEDSIEPYAVAQTSDEEYLRSKLASYLTDEEDTEIKQLVERHGRGDAGGGEEEGADDLSEDEDKIIARADPALVLFQQRVALEPKQVLRYAYGGLPLWCSSPSPAEAIRIPCCEGCGGERVFEAQLMPGLLRHFKSAASEITGEAQLVSGDRSERLALLRRQGGFDFGVVAVWSCENSCFSCNTEYVVVQPAPDHF